MCYIIDAIDHFTSNLIFMYIQLIYSEAIFISDTLEPIAAVIFVSSLVTLCCSMLLIQMQLVEYKKNICFICFVFLIIFKIILTIFFAVERRFSDGIS